MAYAIKQPGRRGAARTRATAATGSMMLAVARAVRVLAGIAFVLIVAAILLRVLGANGSNTIVRDVHDAGRWLVGPFKSLFSIKGAKVSMAVNWGIAAVVYSVVGGFIARLISRAAPRV